MFWIWLKSAALFILIWVGRLLLPPPGGVLPRKRPSLIDPMTPCPACGNRGSSLKYQLMQDRDASDGHPMVLRSCNTCGFICAEEMISVHPYPVNMGNNIG